jgi:hypothetical protein
MGFGKKFKQFTGGIGKAVGDLTGSDLVGRTASVVAGAFTGSIPGMLAGSQGYSNLKTKETQAQGAMNALQDQNALNAQLGEQTKQRLLAEADLKAQEEALRKRTTFAGSSIQGVAERKTLLGI